MIQFPPKNEDELHTLVTEAFEFHQNGELQKAEIHYRQLLTCLPDFWQLYYNLGQLLSDQNRDEEALEIYRQALRLSPSDTDLLFNFAICQKNLGLFNDAAVTYQEILATLPDDIDSHYNYGGCLLALERFEDSFAAYQEVLRRDPDHLAALNNQAYVCHRMGEKTDAAQLYSRILQIKPDHRLADHMLAALTGDHRATAPNSYVADVFDQYSDHYDESLVEKLHYSLPNRLFSAVMAHSGRERFTSLLDLGCGTGMIGETFKEVCELMHGVDLSKKMLEKAQEKETYDRLVYGDILGYLSSSVPGSYELLVAADVFTYVGELTDTFLAAHHAAGDSGLFYFSIERLLEDDVSFQLRDSGRFAHSSGYIRKTAVKTGWDIFLYEQVNLRKEGESWIQGSIFAMRKTSLHE